MTSMATTKAQLLAKVNELYKENADLRRELQQTKWALEAEQIRWSQLATESNAAYGMLTELFALRVYAGPGGDRHSPLEWIIEDKATGEILVERCAPLAAAYYEAITKRLAKEH